MSAINAAKGSAARSIDAQHARSHSCRSFKDAAAQKLEFRHERPRLVISAARKAPRCQTVRNGFEKAVVLNVIAICHQASTRLWSAAVSSATVCAMTHCCTDARSGSSHSGSFASESRITRNVKSKFSTKRAEKPYFRPSSWHSPAINGLKTRLVLLAEVRLGRSDVTKHALEKDARW